MDGTISESIIESPPRRGWDRRRAVLASLVALALAAVAGALVWRSRDGGAPSPSPSSARPSQLYATDGTTLVARFDRADPRESCLAVPVNDWGYYCDAVVSWWRAQAAFGPGDEQRLDRLRHGGYRIQGSLQPQLQAGAKQRVDRAVAVTDPKLFTLAVVEPGTGLVRAMAANRNYRRPPAGSTPPDPDLPPSRPAGPDLVDPLVTGGDQAPGGPEVARAAMDAARCPVGDRSAFGDRCGAGAVPATRVRADVGRPVAGQSGLAYDAHGFSVVIAGPQLACAGLIGAAPGVGRAPVTVGAGLPETAIAAVAATERDGLAPLPSRDFAPPPRELALAS